jgi:recombination protein RecA
VHLLAGGLARWEGVSAFSPAGTPIQAPAWGLPDLTGRLVELSPTAESAHLTAAFGLVLEAQLSGDRAAWVTLASSSFFPPDVIDTGIDLDAMPVVRVSDCRMAGRAVDHLLRSNGFGLVVIDLACAAGSDIRGRCQFRPTQSGASLPVPILSRLLGLARQHEAIVLILTKKHEDVPAMHSLISLRAEVRWRRSDEGYELCVRVLKDKRGGPGWTHVEVCRGPAGLR